MKLKLYSCHNKTGKNPLVVSARSIMEAIRIFSCKTQGETPLKVERIKGVHTFGVPEIKKT